MCTPRSTQIEDWIDASFKVADDTAAERRTRIWEAVQLKHETRSRAITIPRIATVACAVVATAVLLTVAPLGRVGAPAPAMAKVAQGLKALDAPGIVHYRVSHTGRLIERGRVIRSSTRAEECWIDRERRMARTVTGATSLDGSLEAAHGIYVTRDGVTRGLQIDRVHGQRVTTQKEGPSGRNWDDDFDGTISGLRALLDGTVRSTGVTIEILGVEDFKGERVVIVRTTAVLTETATQGSRSTESQTFWLRQRDYVPMQIESVQSEQSDDGVTVSEYREIRTYADYERLSRTETMPELFELSE